MASAPVNVERRLSPDDEESLFPDFPKVVYKRNPLEFVVCEFRFPPILKIDVDVPAQFQEMLRDEYPLYKQLVPLSFGPPELNKLLESANAALMAKSHQFLSVDELWEVSLRRDALSLTCRKYSRWDTFREKLAVPWKALLELYGPQFIVRIGLRYRDVVSKDKLGLQHAGWNELLDQKMVGEFHTPLAPLVAGSWHQIAWKLQREETQIMLQHGLQAVPPSSDVAYIFDTDISTQARKEPKDVFDILKFYNKHSWSVFRSCISDKLHNALEPESV